MKIALVVPGFSSHERDWCIPALLNFARVLAERDEVHVFTLRWPECEGTYPVFGATVHAIGGRKRLGARAIALWARAFATIVYEHRRSPFDVLHAFWADEPGWVAAWTGRRIHRPVIISLAGGELSGLRDIGYGLQLLPGRRALVRWVLRQAANVTAGSNYLLDQARGFVPKAGWTNLRRAPLGVDTALFSPPPPSRRVRLHPVTVVNAGALRPVKGHAALLRAFAALGQPTVTLRIAGAGPDLAELVRLAAELGVAPQVEFVGALSHEAMPAFFCTGDVFAQASRHEAQGMALLEAAACGRPAVGTPVGVLPEIGLSVADADALAGGLAALVHDHARRQAFGQAARELVQTEYSLAAAARRFRRMYAGARSA